MKKKALKSQVTSLHKNINLLIEELNELKEGGSSSDLIGEQYRKATYDLNYKYRKACEWYDKEHPAKEGRDYPWELE